MKCNNCEKEIGLNDKFCKKCVQNKANNQKAIIKQNWCFTRYKIKGINPDTKRKKTVCIAVLGNDIDKAKKNSGLIDISDVQVYFDAPSQAQIDYGRDLGIEYNHTYTKQDYSCLISIVLNEEFQSGIPIGIAEFAERLNVYLSSFISWERAYSYIYHELSLVEKCKFFAFSVYQCLNGVICYDYLNHPKLELFNKFAEIYSTNDRFMNSLGCYSGEDLIPNRSIKNSNAYQICKNYFLNDNNYPLSSIDSDTRRSNDDYSKEESSNIVWCDNCGELVDKNYIYCPNCHKMIFQHIKCEKCGTENNAKNIIYCEKCKHQLQPNPEIENEKSKTKNELKIGIAVIAILVILLIIAFVSCSHKY